MDLSRAATHLKLPQAARLTHRAFAILAKVTTNLNEVAVLALSNVLYLVAVFVGERECH